MAARRKPPRRQAWQTTVLQHVVPSISGGVCATFSKPTQTHGPCSARTLGNTRNTHRTPPPRPTGREVFFLFISVPVSGPASEGDWVRNSLRREIDWLGTGCFRLHSENNKRTLTHTTAKQWVPLLIAMILGLVCLRRNNHTLWWWVSRSCSLFCRPVPTLPFRSNVYFAHFSAHTHTPLVRNRMSRVGDYFFGLPVVVCLLIGTACIGKLLLGGRTLSGVIFVCAAASKGLSKA